MNNVIGGQPRAFGELGTGARGVNFAQNRSISMSDSDMLGAPTLEV